MKRFFSLLLVISFSCILAFGQGFNPQAPMQLDKNVRYGKLDNGLTYYIRHNEKPAQRAEFFIVTNVGAIQETKAQDGLAHFLEHMCLNGTKNFPGKGIISYMESIGAKFGENINASTGVQVTQYMLNNIPLKREGIIDTSLLILHDYAAYVTNDPKEIDAERGVIIEEWRTRRDVSQRMRESAMNAIFTGSKYATCNIIGTKENLQNFKPEELVSFYKTWYKPNNQAIIVVGDVDVDKIEAKIKNVFSELSNGDGAKAKDVIKIPENQEPIVSIFTDKEYPNTDVSILYKSETMPKEYKALGIGLMQDLMKDLISLMINERLSDISKQPNAPFLQAGAGFGEFCATMEAFSSDVQTKDGEGIKGFTALMTEIEKAKRYGFTAAEFDRAKTNLLKGYDVNAENASGRMNAQWVNDCIKHFTDNQPYLDPSYLNEQVKSCLGMFNVDVINKVFPQIITDNNIVILYNSPAREGLAVPTEKDFTDVLAAVKEAKIEAPKNEAVNEPLMDASALKGSKVKKEAKGEFGSTVLTLANGIQIYIKPTDFKKDEVMMKISAKGGSSILPDEDMMSVSRSVFNQIYLSNAGVSKFPKAKLDKILTGKSLNVTPNIGSLTQGVTANGSPKDLETMLQLIYLYYTQPRFNAEEFDVTFNQIKSVLPNMEKQPTVIFQTQMQKTIFKNKVRTPVFTSENLKLVDIKKIESAYKQLFSDAAGAKMIISGNVDINVIKPLLEKYIGSLPVKSKNGKMWRDDNTGFARGQVKNDFQVEMETPKTTVLYLYDGDMKYNLENTIFMEAYTNILDMLYTKTIREDEGGTYGVGVEGDIMQLPKEEFYLLFSFDTDPAKAEKLVSIAMKGLKENAENGINPEYFDKAKKNLLKAFPEKQITNKYWLNVMNEYYMYGFDSHSAYMDTVEKCMTPENMQNFAKHLISQGNLIEVVMSPKN